MINAARDLLDREEGEVKGRCGFERVDCRDLNTFFDSSTRNTHTHGLGGGNHDGGTAKGDGGSINQDTGNRNHDTGTTNHNPGPGLYDKIFSNASLHWILRPPSIRLPFFQLIHRLLRPGGIFVFEMGGHGNVSEVHSALRSALFHRGKSWEEIDRACPWFFPSRGWMEKMLVKAGFEVERVEEEWRPTRLTLAEGEGEGEGNGDGDEKGSGKGDGKAKGKGKEKGGIEGWVRLFGAAFLETLEEEEDREAVVREVKEVVEGVCRREEDDGDGGGDGVGNEKGDKGGWWLGYVRLRGVARKI